MDLDVYMNVNLKHRQLKKSQRGQGLVEFMLILPALLILVIGVIEFGKLMMVYSSVSTASRDAARYAVSVGESGGGLPHYLNCTEIRNEVTKIAMFSDPTITIELDSDGPGGSAPVEYCAGGAATDSINVSLGSQIIVTVATTYQPITPFVNIPSIPISSETRRTVLTEIHINN